MPVMRVSCLCGCGRWWYHTRTGSARPFADLDCWLRAEASGLAEMEPPRPGGRGGRRLRLSAAGRAALAAREADGWVCECGLPARSFRQPCDRCAYLESVRESLAPRESRDQSSPSEVLVRRRLAREERRRPGRGIPGEPGERRRRQRLPGNVAAGAPGRP